MSELPLFCTTGFLACFNYNFSAYRPISESLSPTDFRHVCFTTVENFITAGATSD